jgi:hypothetical protein
VSLPIIAEPAIAGTATRQQRRTASILMLVAERLQQASSLARALPADWRDGAALPPGTLQDVTRELTVLVRFWRLDGGHEKPGTKPGSSVLWLATDRMLADDARHRRVPGEFGIVA